MSETNKIRVKSNTEYTIEVNDNGDTITFDLSDISLVSRFTKMFEKLELLESEYKEKTKDLDETYGEEAAISIENNGETLTLSQKELHIASLMEAFYKDIRIVMDGFLGEGACQKIFGDKNWIDMYDDLIEQLEPHFKKMGLNAEKVRKSAAKKHAPNRSAKRALK